MTLRQRFLCHVFEALSAALLLKPGQAPGKAAQHHMGKEGQNVCTSEIASKESKM